MTRGQAAPRAPTFDNVPLPAPISLHHQNVTLCVDLFFVQGIGFRTITPVADSTHKTILRVLSAVINLNTTRGLTICDIHADNEVECVREELRPIAMNIVTTDSHVGEIERSIRTINERLRSSEHGLPFRRLPKLMITSMVSDSVRCLNQFPWPHSAPPPSLLVRPPPIFLPCVWSLAPMFRFLKTLTRPTLPAAALSAPLPLAPPATPKVISTSCLLPLVPSSLDTIGHPLLSLIPLSPVLKHWPSMKDVP